MINRLTDERRVVNGDDLARHAALGPAILKIRGEVRDLWALDSRALAERLGVLRLELTAVLENTMLENEAA